MIQFCSYTILFERKQSMGKSSKAQDAAMRREYQEKRRREEEEKRRRENRLMWQIVIGVVAIIVVISAVAVGISLVGKQTNDEAETDDGLTDNQNAPKMEDLDFSEVAFENIANTETVTDYVRLNVSYTDGDGFERTGDIVVCLFPDVAPKTVENFKDLVESDFYDGLTFHRIYSGFMIQGGDPEGDGTGDSGRTIQGEFTVNGHTNNLSHVRGVLSMARGGYSYNSASCQFFIVHQNSTGLDGQYASFGYVVYGMDTVDGIASTKVEKAKPDSDEITSPVNPVTINYATFVEVSK